VPQKRPGARRLARECALQALYQLDSQLRPGEVRAAGPVPAQLADEVLAQFWAHFAPEGGAGADAVEFAETLVRGVARDLEAVDAAIQRTSQHWRLERMARVDRNVLRVATWELLHMADVPARVVLNEAVELGKRYGSEESGAFVNGVLDRLARELRAGEDTGGRGLR
jgi:transcription antitermination protein NusB